MQIKSVLGGLLEVNEIGEVFRVKDGERVPVPQNATSKNGRYLAVSYSKNKMQRHEYVHRLVATAFIPNPDNLPQVNHKDGNGHNNHVDNLEWVTAAQNIQHAYRLGLIDPYRYAKPCQECGKPTNARDRVCTDCKPEINKRVYAESKRAAIEGSVSSINLGICTMAQRRYVSLRKRGYTYQEIASICGVSRQCVDQAIRAAELKTQQKGAPHGTHTNESDPRR